MISWGWINVDCADASGLAAFWGEVFGVEPSEEGGSCAEDPPMWSVAPPGASVKLLFYPVLEGKSVKNRLHLDLRAEPGEQDAEVDRLLAVGAVRADVGQRDDQPFVVLADPEGNEFCVLPGKAG